MNARSLVVMGVLVVWVVVETLAATASAQTATSSARGAPRTPWGDPDLQGMWTNATATPLERPKELGAKQILSDHELVERDRQVARANSTDNVPPAGNPGFLTMSSGGSVESSANGHRWLWILPMGSFHP